MKKPIFHFENESYKAFEDYLFTFMPVNKCKDIYVIIDCIEDLCDYIQINGQIQKTCSTETPAYTIVRNIMYWYIDCVDDIRNFLYDNCNCYDMTVPEEEVRYEKILKTLKKYTARKNPELNDFFGGTDMKKHIFDGHQESFIDELNDIANKKGVLTEKDLTNAVNPEPIIDPEEVTRATLLDAAKKCVCSDRNKQYGSPENNFGIIAKYWKEYLGCDITAMDVGIMMTLFKIGRMQSGGYKPDNFVDAIGYLACAGECGAKFNIDDGDKCGYGKCTDCWIKGEEV